MPLWAPSHPQDRCWPVPVWALTPRGREAVGLPSGTSAWDGWAGWDGVRERSLGWSLGIGPRRASSVHVTLGRLMTWSLSTLISVRG